MTDAAGSEYLHWQKTRKPARFDLASSGVLPCSMVELGASIEDLEVTGPALYGFKPLQEAIAAHCAVPAEYVVTASGTSMANFLAMTALVRPGDEVLIEHPAYEPLVATARYLGAEVRRFQRGISEPVQIALSEEMLTSRTKLVVLTNLHNPTCCFLPETEIRRIAELVGRVSARLLVDEVYLECMYEKACSAIHSEGAIVCTSSLTKAYGLGGLRCGWILAEPALAQQIWRIKDLVDPGASRPAERLSVVAFRELRRLAARARRLLDGNRAILAEFLNSCPQLEAVVPHDGTCVFPRIRSGNGDELAELLHRDFDTDVVPGRFFEMPNHFRLGIGCESGVLAEGLRKLRRALESMPSA